MKIRIIGTSSLSHINSFKKLIENKILSFSFRVIENKIFIINDSNKIIMEFNNNNATLRQTLEVWQAFGLIEKIDEKYNICCFDQYQILKIIKDNLIKKHSDFQIQITRNSKLLLIEYASRKLSNKELKLWNVKQTKGDLTTSKIQKEISIIEKELIKDKKFIARVREVLYEQINKEL